ncbi:hypothetical protein Poly51_40540 [Rubripirellula tenax]|uniref:Uncharacterized protein n=1 Tax=Rubripirellula tenax TaxID=2528015 RepID=A0A5C6ETU0_9BACT|nr:hypothetical protein Poly51_40540 [Rubripirellula tenax]
MLGDAELPNRVPTRLGRKSRTQDRTIVGHALMPTNSVVVSCDKRITQRPVNEAGAMHARVRESPKRIIGISDKVRCTNDVITIRENFAAD